MTANRPNHNDDHLPAPLGLLVAFGLAVLGALALTAVAVLAFRQPVERSQDVERLRYEHTMTFDYTLQVAPSFLYGSETLGPVTAPPPGVNQAAGEASLQPLYTRLAKSLDLGFTYTLTSRGLIHQAPTPMNQAPTLMNQTSTATGAVPVPDVAGEISAALRLRAGEKPGEGWTKTLPLEPAGITFTGPTAAARVLVDFPTVLGLIEAMEKETDFKPPVYEVAVIPTVRITGSVGPQAVEETFAPAFTMKLNRTQITLDPELRRSEVKSLKDTIVVPQSVHLPGLTLPVRTARWVGTGGALLALVVAGTLAAVIFLGLGRTEPEKIRARYGTMLVSVADADLNDDLPRVEVASIHDLARLAKRDGGTIFHQELAPGLHLYFVPEGTVTYEYVVANGAHTPREARSATGDEA